MAQKLKNLCVKKVDFVDEGANQGADIKLYKRKDAVPAVEETALEESIAKKIVHALAGVFKSSVNVQKENAASFKEKMDEVSAQKILDEIWSVCYALQASLGSVILDEELDASEKQKMLGESIDDFSEAMKQYAANWSGGAAANIRKNFDTPDKTELPVLIHTQQNIEALIRKVRGQEGELEEMIKIDKFKMTPEERTAYDEIVKKYAVEQEETVEKKAAVTTGDNEDEIEEADAEKRKERCRKSVTLPPTDEVTGDIYKGLHPAVKAEIEALKKYREESETRELTEIAKKYEVIGKKTEDLVPLLKSMKAAGGTAYADMIALLDSTVATVQQSGVFGEIGKSREGAPEKMREEAVAKVRAQAAEIRKSRPELSYAQAMDEAMLSDPELLAELDR